MTASEKYRIVYLKSPHWIKFRAEWKKRNEWACAIDGCKAKNLDLHHLTYKRKGRERDYDVVPLCRLHHSVTHDLVKRGVPLDQAHRHAAMTASELSLLLQRPFRPVKVKRAKPYSKKMKKERAKEAGYKKLRADASSANTKMKRRLIEDNDALHNKLKANREKRERLAGWRASG